MRARLNWFERRRRAAVCLVNRCRPQCAAVDGELIERIELSSRNGRLAHGRRAARDDRGDGIVSSGPKRNVSGRCEAARHQSGAAELYVKGARRRGDKEHSKLDSSLERRHLCLSPVVHYMAHMRAVIVSYC
jgi:hypothetical protein